MLEKEIDKLGDILKSGKIFKIVVVPHISPDGDAAGSCSALAILLKKLGHKVNIVSSDIFPEYLHLLKNIDSAVIGKNNISKAQQLIEEADYIFMLDHNTYKREGVLETFIENANAKKIIIDHHLYPDAVDIVISQVGISSTCELLFKVITKIFSEELIDTDIANSLYCGINTDTGCFRHSSFYSDVYRVVASLIDRGAEVDKINNYIHCNNTISRLRLLGNALLNKLEILEDLRIAIIPITKEELEEFDYKDGDLEGLVNMPLSLSNIDISVQITQRKEKVKLSFRSKRDIPVNLWASNYFNGGGHRNAAGGHSFDSFESVVAQLKSSAPEFIKSLK